jgi:hypothetical protein
MATWMIVDGVGYEIGSGRDPEIRLSGRGAQDSYARLPAETRADVIARAAEHVRHARSFSLPLGRLYGATNTDALADIRARAAEQKVQS